MTAGAYNFKIKQGDTFSLPLTYKINGALVNLTGYTARLIAKNRASDVASLINLTTENGGIALGGAAGTITLSMSKTATAALTFDRAVYDLELTSGGGTPTTLLSGTITLIPDVAP